MKQSAKFHAAGKKKQAADLPENVQAALETRNIGELLTYINSQIEATNMPPAHKAMLLKVLRIVMLVQDD